MTLSPSVPDTPKSPVRWPVLLLVALGLALFFLGQSVVTTLGIVTPVVCALLGLALIAGWWTLRRNESFLARLRCHLEEHTDSIDAIPEQRLGWWIALASGAGLFVELVLIRWQASACHLFAYYKNVSLLAAFLGLGIGYALGHRRPLWTPIVIPALAAQFALLFLLRFSPLQRVLHNPIPERPSLGILNGMGGGYLALSYGFLILFFTFTVLTCIPLGHLASRLMKRKPSLVAYSWNLIGSLLGIGLFTLLSFTWAAPSIWLILSLGALLPFLLLRPQAFLLSPSIVAVGIPLVIMALPWSPTSQDIYSPYQKLSVNLQRGAPPTLEINHVYHQAIHDLRPEVQARSQKARDTAKYYELPFQFKPQPQQVLVVGSGTGNDVAAALRSGAQKVDAVEIDPAILSLGKQLHPEQPYQNPRVHTHLDDARNYLRSTDQNYDVIVYGLLDSHTLLSNRSSVRLDSFVYTVEAFREARARLKPNGLITMTFSLLSEAQGRKFYLMLKAAFDGKEPRVYNTKYDRGYVYVIGPGLEGKEAISGVALEEETAKFRSSTVPVTVSTDDWPFLYIPLRKYPVSYAYMGAILLVISLLIIYQMLSGRKTKAAPGFSLATCFFLGAGFMLVETRSITDLGLSLGNTWHVISAVIAGILIMAFFANWCIQRFGSPSPLLTYGCIAIALLLGLLVSSSSLISVSPVLAKIVAVGLATLPLFFSGFAFSGELKRNANVSGALAANLFGAMLGGLLEYNSLYFGFRSLYGFALVTYGLAFLCTMLSRRSVPAKQPCSGEHSAIPHPVPSQQASPSGSYAR